MRRKGVIPGLQSTLASREHNASIMLHVKKGSQQARKRPGNEKTTVHTLHFPTSRCGMVVSSFHAFLVVTHPRYLSDKLSL